jgi:SAM-dependent methyltransferase
LRSVPCYHCGSRDGGFYAAENGFELVKCTGCGLLYVNPRPDDREIDEAHQLGLHEGEQAFDATGWYHPEKVGEYLEVLRDFFPEGLADPEPRWLDIGCGFGEFLTALARWSRGGVLATGVEPNVRKRQAAQKRGVDVTYFDLETHGGRYDVLSALNVYSHLPDPPATLARWKRLLEPGGELLLQTGDTAHLPAAVHYRPFYLPDHLSFASEGIVCGILERLGFEVLGVRKYPFVRPSPASWLRETAKLLVPGKVSRLRYLIRYRAYVTDMYVRARLRG